MKRYLYFVFFIGFLFLTGCKSSTTLNCTSTSSIGDSSVSTQSYDISFINDRVSNLSLLINVQLNDADEVTRSNISERVDYAFGSYKNRRGIDYSSSSNDDGFNVSIKVNFDKISNEDRSSITLINPEKGYDDLKTDFESIGFICK